MLIQNKKGIGLLTETLFVSAMLSAVIFSTTNWYLSFNQNLNNLSSDIEKMNAVQNKWEKFIQNDYDSQMAMAGKKDVETIGNYTITTTYGETGVYGSDGSCTKGATITKDMTRCIPVHMEIVDNTKPDGSPHKTQSLDTYSIANKTDNYTKEELTQRLKHFVKNDSYSSGKPLGLKIEKNAEGDDQVFAYSGNENIPLYPEINMLGKPEWNKAKDITFPYIATEDGFIWTHLKTTVENKPLKLNVITENGKVLKELLMYDTVGPKFLPVNKGDKIVHADTVSIEVANTRLDFSRFVPFQRKMR